MICQCVNSLYRKRNGDSKKSYYHAVKVAIFQHLNPCRVFTLSDDDFDKRKDFYELILKIFDENPSKLKKIFGHTKVNSS